MSEPVTITALQAERFKRLKAVQLKPTAKGLTVIGGKNRAGKTSVLDAIVYALGGEKRRPTDPKHRDAEEPPVIHLELSNGLIVERKGKNSSLTVTDPTGMKGNQTVLNQFVEQLALDLPAFMHTSSKGIPAPSEIPCNSSTISGHSVLSESTIVSLILATRWWGTSPSQVGHWPKSSRISSPNACPC